MGELILPEEVIEAARVIDTFMKNNNHKDWRLGGVCDREFAVKYDKAVKTLQSVEDQCSVTDDEDARFAWETVYELLQEFGEETS